MTLPKDPYMLLSMINMKLRDEFNTLEELCATLDVDENTLKERLADAGFSYRSDINQFR